MEINLYYWNNGVGVVNDAILIKALLSDYDVVSYDISKTNEYRKGDLGIFIQNIQADQLPNNKKNIFIINEEWLNQDEVLFLSQFDYLIVKSDYAKQLLVPYHANIVQTGFFSLDRYFFPRNTGKVLHFKGKSIQKNSELIYNYKDSIKVLDSESEYLSDSQVDGELNTHDIHICCSLYEGWGHYLWEAMSCGKLVICSEIPVFKEYLDPDLVKFIPTKNVCRSVLGYKFLDKSKFIPGASYIFREGHFVDISKFDEMLRNIDELLEFQRKNSKNIRNHFLEVNNKNKRKFLSIVNYII